MGREDQKEEREVLDSIFPDEIQDVSETEYRVTVKLDLPDAQDDEEQEPPSIILKVSYPEDYPDIAPDLDISAPHNAIKHPHLDVQEDKARLLEALKVPIEENLGMAMVFTLVSALKEEAETLIAERANVIVKEKEAAAAKAEEEENRKFQGTRVTTETFTEWLNKFKKETEDEERRQQEALDAEDKKKKAVREEKRMTGRELWEKGIAKGGDEEDEGDLAEDVGKLKVAS